MIDVIIIGAGPAGITSSIYAVRKGLNILVLTLDIGGQAAWSGDVENYTGFRFVSGPQLASEFEKHMKEYKIRVNEGEEVLRIEKKYDIVLVKTSKSDYEAKSVIIASGKRAKELGVSGEKEYKNKGLTYCATCDGPLFKGKTVAVIGGGNAALDAVLSLVNIAEHIYVINISKELTADKILEDKVRQAKNVTVMNSAEVKAVLGKAMVDAIKVSEGRSDEKELAVKGIFVEIGLIPNSGFADIVKKSKEGEIVVNSYNQTNIPGIFAAGDVTDVPEKQIIIAAGEGAKAALSAFSYLSRRFT
ncbi:MAG: FAD-dependent oxidoreductase [Candidatus Omnitrophota bacterium]